MVATPQKRRARRIFVGCKGAFKAYLCRHPIVVNMTSISMTNQYSTEDQVAYIYELLGIGECEEIEFKSAKGGFTKEIWPT